MSVIALVLILLFLGGLLWLINCKIPGLNPTIKWLINAVVIVVAILLVLSAFGVWEQVKGVRVPRL